jgi:hypothetical protein
MIEGILFEVASNEMAQLFGAKAEYHRQRGAQQAEELPKLRQIIDGLKVPAFVTTAGTPGVTWGNSGYRTDPVEELEQRIASHKTQAAKLDFYAKHVIEGERYRVSASDLALLGLDDGSWQLGIAFRR